MGIRCWTWGNSLSTTNHFEFEEEILRIMAIWLKFLIFYWIAELPIHWVTYRAPFEVRFMLILLHQNKRRSLMRDYWLMWMLHFHIRMRLQKKLMWSQNFFKQVNMNGTLNICETCNSSDLYWILYWLYWRADKENMEKKKASAEKDATSWKPYGHWGGSQWFKMWPICDETATLQRFFELAEPRFRRDMERNFRILAIFPDRDRNRILNHWGS